jgi:hypothetical protein
MVAANVHPTGSNGDWEKGAIDMKPRTIIPLVVGLGVGFFAIKMVIDMVQKAKGEQGEGRPDEKPPKQAPVHPPG